MYYVQMTRQVFGIVHFLQVILENNLKVIIIMNLFLILFTSFLGWSREECDILRKALMKYGIGNWAQIIGSNCLPGKTNAQMNLQLQRMLGQQSTAGSNKSFIDSEFSMHF